MNETQTLLSPDQIQERRAQERSRKRIRKATRRLLAATGVSLALVGVAVANKPQENPKKAEMRAALLAKALPTANPNIVIEPYTVGSERPQDVFVSEVAADLHPMLSDSDDASITTDRLESYLPEGETSFTPGQQLEIGVNTEDGTVVPKAELPPSGESNS
jgi:hypothetical protein